MFGSIFQITNFKKWKYIIVCLICVCFFILKKRMRMVKVLLFYLKKEKVPSFYLTSIVCVVLSSGCRSYQVSLMVFNIFTKMSLSNIIWKLKIGRRSSLNSVFKYLKIKNVTQTLLNKISYQTLFFYPTVLSV